MSATNGGVRLSLVLQIVASTLFIVATISAPLILMYSKVVTLQTQLNEIETQFKANDEFRNVNLAGQMRINSMLWQKVFDQTFPSETYYPTISNRKDQGK
jgi:hypothetical protein